MAHSQVSAAVVQSLSLTQRMPRSGSAKVSIWEARRRVASSPVTAPESTG